MNSNWKSLALPNKGLKSENLAFQVSSRLERLNWRSLFITANVEPERGIKKLGSPEAMQKQQISLIVPVE